MSNAKIHRKVWRLWERAARAGVREKEVPFTLDNSARLVELERLERCGVISKERADGLREELGAVRNDKLLCGGCDE